MKKFALIILLLTGSLIGQTKITNAIDYYNSGKFQIAKSLLSNILEEDNNNPEVNYYLSKIYFELFQEWNNEDYLDSAIEFCERAIELSPNNSEYQLEMGKLRIIEINYASIFNMPGIASDMKEALLKAVELNPKSVDAKFYLAMFYVNAPGLFGGDMDEAKKLLNDIQSLDELMALELKLTILARDDKLIEAKTHLDKFTSARISTKKTDKKLANCYNNLAYYFLNNDRKNEMNYAIKRANELAPDDTTKLFLKLRQEKAINRYYEKPIIKSDLSKLNGLYKCNQKIIQIESDDDFFNLTITSENSNDVYKTECKQVGENLFVDSESGKLIYIPDFANGDIAKICYPSYEKIIEYKRIN